MSFWRIGKTAVMLSMLLAVPACAREAPIYNVESHPVPAMAQSLPLETMQRTIMLAGMHRGWVFTPIAPGHLRGHLDHNHHVADIDVAFTPANYSIHYLGSENLLATADGQIHRNYNKWIELLERDIEHNLAEASLR
jgi:hypothetical protein